MYCTSCGAERPDNATSCPRCAQPVAVFPVPESVPNYLVQSILVTLCCCLPGGIVALIYSSQVNTKLAAGDMAGAQASSRQARTWVVIALILGIVSGLAGAGIGFLSK